MEHSPKLDGSFGAGTLGQARRQWTLARLPFPPAGDAHRANAAQTQQVAGHFEPVAVGAESRQQPCGPPRPGSGQIVKEEAVGMRAKKFSNPPFFPSDEGQKTLELLGQQFNSQGVGSDDGQVSGQGLGFLD